MISIIIRTKNEERWIALCLAAVWRQSCQDFEVILVDNESSDRTVEKAREFDIKLVTISDFTPGRAINLGVKHSSGDIIVCLSGHCIPVQDDWLETLVQHLEDPSIAGVYGRQQPMSFSSDRDKRDLLTIFGLDKRLQKKDSFFHNANSAITKKMWEKYPFDEAVTNIEDRLWGAQVISDSYKIAYEPEASVYHYHGIHHDYDDTRRRNVATILESLDPIESSKNVDLSALQIVALVPVKGDLIKVDDVTLIDYTLERAHESKYINETLVLSDNEEIMRHAEATGAHAPFKRPPDLSRDYVALQQVLAYCVSRLSAEGVKPDICIVLEQTYPFRPEGLLDEIIECFMGCRGNGLMPVYRENRSAFLDQGGEIDVISPMMPRNLRTANFLIDLFGLGFVTYPRLIEDESFGLDNLKRYEVDGQFIPMQVRDVDALASLQNMLKAFWK